MEIEKKLNERQKVSANASAVKEINSVLRGFITLNKLGIINRKPLTDKEIMKIIKYYCDKHLVSVKHITTIINLNR